MVRLDRHNPVTSAPQPALGPPHPDPALLTADPEEQLPTVGVSVAPSQTAE